MSKENEIELMSFTEDGQRWLQCKSCYEYKKLKNILNNNLFKVYNDKPKKKTNG